MKSNQNLYFKLFECCRPVKGVKNAVIYDLQRGFVKLINQDLFDILTNYNNLNINEIKEIYGNQNYETIDEYFDFLLDEEFIFLCSKEELQLFPNMDLDWDSPSIISNAIIDIDFHKNYYNYEKTLTELSNLGCIEIMIRLVSEKNPVYQIREILHILETSRIEKVQFCISYNHNYKKEFLLNLKSEFPRLVSILIFNHPKITPTLSFNSGNFEILCTENNVFIQNHTSCGQISLEYFTVDTEFYLESLNYNNCLNKKVSITHKGLIKNCPALNSNFGSLEDFSISEVIKKNNFKKLWNIKKDEVEKCKDCEFRYMCSDCRAYTEDGRINSKPINCKYDPYEGKWRTNK